MNASAIFREAKRLFQFYQAAIVNTAFGVSLYTVFVWLGANIYIAHATAHILGVAFNYFTYSRIAFSNEVGSKPRFVLAYVGNYLVGLASLATVAQFVRSPYIAGFTAAFVGSLVDYIVLRKLVFVAPTAAKP